MIKKKGGRYQVTSKAGRPLGKPTTKKKARAQLAAVEIAKKRRGK